MEILVFVLAVLFSLNMGAPSFAGSFSTAYGSGVISRRWGGVLFLMFALLGALTMGKEVASTLSKGIIPKDLITISSAIIILFAATMSLFMANLMHIPQSTSMSTIASICGVGMHFHSVNWGKIQNLSFWWVVSAAVAYFLIFYLTRSVYPPRKKNFWVYEKIINNKERLKWFVIITSCYKAFAQGSNNVANAVGPLSSAGLMDVLSGLFIMGIFFGLGAFGFSGPLKTSSHKIVPLGLLTATIINIVVGSLTIFASKVGIPFPTVIIYTVAIFAIGSIKDGLKTTFDSPVTRKAFFTWCINPVITFGVSFILSMMFLK